MEIGRAHELLAALADGADPLTGEILPREHVCNQPEIIRALHEALKALEAAAPPPEPAPVKPERLPPQNAGKPWTQAEEEKLLDGFDAGLSLSAIAKEHGRTRGAIRSRLESLGKLERQEDKKR